MSSKAVSGLTEKLGHWESSFKIEQSDHTDRYHWDSYNWTVAGSIQCPSHCPKCVVICCSTKETDARHLHSAILWTVFALNFIKQLFSMTKSEVINF